MLRWCYCSYCGPAQPPRLQASDCNMVVILCLLSGLLVSDYPVIYSFSGLEVPRKLHVDGIRLLSATELIVIYYVNSLMHFCEETRLQYTNPED